MSQTRRPHIRRSTLFAVAFLALLIAACTPPTPTFDLTVALAGDGSGNVTSSPAGISTGASDFVGTFTQGTEVTLTAVAADGSAFVDFDFADATTCEAGSTATTCIVTMTAAETVTATFEAEQFVVASSGIELESFRFASGSYTSTDTTVLPGVAFDPNHAIFGLTMHPTNPWLFVSSMIRGTWGDARIDVFEFDGGAFTHVATNAMVDYSSLGCWFAVDSDSCALTEMAFDLDGTRLYVNEDSSDVVATFTVDTTTGVLTYVDDTPTVGYQGLVRHPGAPYLYNGLNVLEIVGGVPQADPTYSFTDGGNGPMVFETDAGWRLLGAIDNQDVVLADLTDPANPLELDRVVLPVYEDARFASADLASERVIVVGDDKVSVMSFAGDALTDLVTTPLDQLVLGTERVFRGVAWVPGTNTAVAAWLSTGVVGGYTVLEIAADGSVTIVEELDGAGQARAVIVAR